MSSLVAAWAAMYSRMSCREKFALKIKHGTDPRHLEWHRRSFRAGCGNPNGCLVDEDVQSSPAGPSSGQAG